jgi:hypothetical protein
VSRWAFLLSMLLASCGGSSDPCEPVPATIAWDAERGLVVTLHRPIDAGASLEIGQTIDDPTAMIQDWVTIGGSDVFAETTDGRAAGFVVMSLPAPRSLGAGTVITHRLERLDRTGLVRPSSAWLSVDGMGVAHGP